MKEFNLVTQGPVTCVSVCVYACANQYKSVSSLVLCSSDSNKVGECVLHACSLE